MRWGRVLDELHLLVDGLGEVGVAGAGQEVGVVGVAGHPGHHLSMRGCHQIYCWVLVEVDIHSQVEFMRPELTVGRLQDHREVHPI